MSKYISKYKEYKGFHPSKSAYWAVGKNYSSGWTPSTGVDMVIADISYKSYRFTVAIQEVIRVIKRIAVFIFNKENRVGINNLRLTASL